MVYCTSKSWIHSKPLMVLKMLNLLLLNWLKPPCVRKLDKTLAERAYLNSNIVLAINSAAEDWGIRCLCYEIRDIHPPSKVVESMHQQVSAERTKRAQILESEGARQAAINVAEGKKRSTILASEANKMEQINRASGEAEAILLRAQASSRGIENISQAIGLENGYDAVSLSVAEKYVEAFGRMAKEGTTLIVPAAANDAASMVTQALTIYNSINKRSSSSNDAAVHSIMKQTTNDLVDVAKHDEPFAEHKNTGPGN